MTHCNWINVPLDCLLVLGEGGGSLLGTSNDPLGTRGRPPWGWGISLRTTDLVVEQPVVDDHDTE